MSHVRVGLLLGLASAASGVLLMFGTGVDPVTAGLIVAAVAWQALGGAFLWRSRRPTASALELLGMGLALGTALAALAGVASATLGLGPWGWVLPSGVVLAAAAVRRRSGSPSIPAASGRRDHRLSAWVGFVAAIVPGLALWASAVRLYPLEWMGSWSGYHPDMPFFEALGVSLARFGAFSSPFLPGASVRYHWLTYAWQGQIEVSTQAPGFVGLTRLMPLVALLGCAAIAAAWSARLSGRRWVPVLAGLLLATGGFSGAIFGGVLTTDSPSQSMSVLWLLAFTVLVSTVVRRRVGGVRLPWLALIGVMAFALMGGKVSAGAPAVAGTVALAVGLAVMDRARARAGWQVLGATALGALGGFLFFTWGAAGGGGLTLGSLVDKSSSQQGLNPVAGGLGVVLGTLILVLAVLPRWAGLLPLAASHPWRRRPETLLGLGMALSSIAALVVFNSFNEVWFSSTVSGPLAIISAIGAALALGDLALASRRSSAVLLIIAAGFAAASFAVTWLLWSTGASGGNVFTATLRWAGPLAAVALGLLGGVVLSGQASGRITWRHVASGAVLILVIASVPGRLLGVGTGQIGVLQPGIRGEWFSTKDTPDLVGIDAVTLGTWTETSMGAAGWLRGNSEPSDLVATNLTHGPFVPGVTQRPTYVSAMGYQAAYGRVGIQEQLLGNEAQAWAFITAPSSVAAAPLCAAGVRWLWIDPSRTDARDWSPWASVVYTAPDAVIARIEPKACRAG